MSSLADQLRAIADQLDGGVTPLSASLPVEATPAGFVRVTPTGVQAKGSRLYPTLQALSLPNNVNCWSYAVRMAFENMRRPDGTMYCSQPTVWAIRDRSDLATYINNGYSVAKAGGDPTPFFAEAIDRAEYPEDWMTQVELDRQNANLAAHQNAPWVSSSSSSQQQPASEEVVITNEG